jgi:DNA-binding MarR family transcriptional regulator
VKTATVNNIVGAFAQALVDQVEAGVGRATDQGPTSAAALVHLSKYGGEGINALRVPLALSQPGCVRLVDRLQEQSLVARRAATDGRAVALHLTPGGRAAARRALARRGRALERALAGLSARERMQLGTLAAKVLQHLVRDESQALQTCRLCDYGVCPDATCPVEKALAAPVP